jgi:hypothetical protein
MLIARLHPENTDGIIYHYCSAQTLLSIVKFRTVRFSDATLLNDGEEGAWGYHIFQKAAERLSKPENIPKGRPVIPSDFFECVAHRWLSLTLKTRHLVACFSTDGDSLSQWRAYADDGRGVAIGFKAKDLRTQLPVQVYDVLYEEEQQISEMVEALGATYLEFVDKGADYDADWFMQRCAEFPASSIALKNPAWRDEKEVRCHHMIVADASAEKWTLIDPGGNSINGKVAPRLVQFEARNGSIVPFVDLPFPISTEGASPIAEVVLGPRCPTDEATLRFLMGGEGYGNVSVRWAGSAYRK